MVLVSLAEYQCQRSRCSDSVAPRMQVPSTGWIELSELLVPVQTLEAFL